MDVFVNWKGEGEDLIKDFKKDAKLNQMLNWMFSESSVFNIGPGWACNVAECLTYFAESRTF